MSDVQLNVVPGIVAVGVKANGSALQICCDKDAAMFVITGTGLTVTVISSGAPLQMSAVGVIL
jgi:hypothetical protein